MSRPKLTPLEMLFELYRAGQVRNTKVAGVEPRITRQPEGDYPELRGIRKKCPHCGETKDGLTGFGPRKIRGKIHLQSYCRACRSSGTPRAGER